MSTLFGLLAGCPGALPISTPTPTPTPSPAPSPAPTIPVEPTQLERFRQELATRGLEIRPGVAAELDPEDCCLWETCYLFNPDNRYVGWWLPPGPGQVVANPILDAQGRSLAWRLRADEAVVAVGQTPPPAPYFSYRSYLHDRWFPELNQRDWVFFNLGDSQNQFVIGTGPGGPFDAQFVLTTTAHAGVDALVREAALAAGYPEAALNTDVIAGDDLVMGLHDQADTFRMQNRMSLFDDPDQGKAYLADPPVTVWRITPTRELPEDPLVPEPLRPRGTGTDESAWSGALEALDASIRQTHGDYAAHDLPLVVPTADDDECPPGCNRDTFFAVSIHFLLPTWSDAFVMVYGVNHEHTGKSVYSNFSVIGVDQLSGIAAVNSQDMPGTASAYLPDHPQVDDLYAYKIARDCGGEVHCIEIPVECPGFDSLHEGSLAFRAYTEASTATGPSTGELLLDRAILFTRPATPPESSR